MSAYMIVHGNVNDMEKFKSYSEAAAVTLKKFNAELLFKGKVTEIITGDHPYQMSAVIKFPDKTAIRQWYDSVEYQELISLRNSAAEMVFIGIEE